MSLKLRIYYNAIFGAIGGLFSWFLLGRIPTIAHYHILIRDMISGALIGTFIGVAVSLVDGVFSRSVKRAMMGGYYGAFSGAIGGAIGLLFGELALFLLSGGILGRASGWLFIGLAVGISEGMVNRSRRRSSYGAIGGALGGFIGGAVFESLRQVSSSYLLSQALGMIILGACIGSLIAIVQDVLKQAVLKVQKGRQEGKEFPLFQERALVGSAERCDIGIFGTPGVAMEHAEIRQEMDDFLLKDLGQSPEGVLVNDQRLTQEHRLKNGDEITVGKAVLLFSRKRKDKTLPAGAPALGLLLVAIVFLISMFPCGLQAQGWGTQVRQIEKVDFPDITLYVGVTDNRGDPIQMLTEDNFRIREDGKLVLITEFLGPGAGELTIALVIDKSSSMSDENKLGGAQDAAVAFVNLMRDKDSTSLFAFSNRPKHIQALTSDRDLLIQQIRQIRPNGSTACYDAIYQALESLEGKPGIRAVIVLSDGGDNQSSHSPDEVITLAQTVNTPVYTIGLGSKRTGNQQIYEPILQKIAAGTGGEYFYSPSAAELTKLYKRTSSQLQYGYGLVYQTPRPTKDGTERRVTVSVNHARLSKKATGRYYIPGVTVPKSSFALFISLLVPLIFLLILPSGIRHLRKASNKATPSGQPTPGPPLSQATGQPQASLIACGHQTPPAAFDITQTPITIGQGPENNMVISHQTVSNSHAEIRQENDRYVVEDKGSTNGTFVSFQGQPEKLRQVTTKNALKDGSLIYFGGVSYFLRIEH